LLSRICDAFGSDSDIQLLLSSWLVKYLAGFGKFSSNCSSDWGGNADIMGEMLQGYIK